MAVWLERTLVVLVTAATVAVSALAGTGGINGVRTGELSARFDLPFTPAGWAFSIWGLIYLALAAFAVYQLAGRGAGSARVEAIRGAYAFSGVANMAWLWFWHHEAFPATLLVMLMLLAALAHIVRSLAGSAPRSAAESWCVDGTFSLYLGWISVATLANLGVVVATVPAIGIDRQLWSQVMLGVVLGVGVFGWRRLRDPVFLGVLTWAAAAIALKTGQHPAMALPALAVAGLTGIAAIGLLLGSGREPRAGPQSTTA